MLMDSWQERFGTFMPGEAAVYNWNMAALCCKLTTDFRDQQRADGWFRMYGAPISLDYPALKHIIADLPWLSYLYYGDLNILKENYPSIKKYAELVAPKHDLKGRTWQPKELGRAEAGCGDHGRPGSRWYGQLEGDLYETMVIANFFKTVESIARVLGEESDAENFRKIWERLLEKCNRDDFLNSEEGLYVGGDQGGHSLALALDIAPAELREKAAAALIRDIMEKRGGHLNTGFGGTVYLLKTLIKLNRPDIAHSIIANETPPSVWGMLHHPQTPERLTVMPEFWTGGMIPHPGLSTIGFWFYQSLGGIMPDPKTPGFKHIIIRPQLPPSLEWVNAEYRSIRGTVRSNWRKQDGRFRMEVVIPANTTASVYVPGKEARCTEPKESIVGTRGTEYPEGYTAFSVPGGCYTFESAVKDGMKGKEQGGDQ
jgi:alpha-L-rhamnosidase